jgi:hypothetical protein
LSDQFNALYSFTIEGSRHPLTENVDYSLILPRTLIVPKNSNIQVVYSNLEHSLARAQRFKEPFRTEAIKAVMADFKGLISISSEGGAFIHEFNTTRGGSINPGVNVGPEVTWLDEYLHEQVRGNTGAMKHNPKKAGLGIEI